MKFNLKIADFIIEVNHSYDFIKNQCEKYITDEKEVDFSVSATEEQIKEEMKIVKDVPETILMGYCESVCLYRAICLELPRRDAFVMHSAVIAIGDEAYAFTAKSGTGKSTHIRLWKQLLGDKVYAINGDKPIIKLINGELYAYGTPWCGKENWSTNTKAKLKALYYLQRSEKNFVEPMPKDEGASLIMKQIIVPNDTQGAIKTFELLDKMLNQTKLFRLGCNISIEAAELAYNALNGGKNEN